VSILFVASEPPKYQRGSEYLGAHGRLLDRMLSAGGFMRSDCKVISADQYRPAMADDFDVVMLAGEFAGFEALGWETFPSFWHGSAFPLQAQRPTSYDAYRSWCLEAPKFVVTYDIPTLHNAWDLHPLAIRDWQRAGAIARGEYQAPNPDAWEWVVNTPGRLDELADSPMLLFDTELSPVWMIGFANDKQVHVADWGFECVEPARALLQSESILKVAHNLQHDLAMAELRFGFRVSQPYFDTYGGAHLLNTALERSLSPGISARFTNWPYHKWLSNVDATRYNGLDNIVGYQGAVEIRKQLHSRGLMPVSDHDHRLLGALFQMQLTGFRVDEGKRAEYEQEQTAVVAAKVEECTSIATPVVRARLSAFEKPHLFHIQKQCSCCGGGKTTRAHCWRCGGLPAKPSKKADYPAPDTPSTVAELRAALPPCSVCQATGKVGHWLPFNPGSDDAVKDVLYKGLRIPARRYKGKVTTAAAQLKPLQNRHPLVKAIVEYSALDADLKTVQRLRPGNDGRLHCVFDPWGTESGRVAGKEGLLSAGTNPMNVPKRARRFVVPDPGYFFLYPDLSQVEARAVAVLSGDPGLIRAFTEPVNWPGHPKHGVIDSHTIVQQMVSRWVEITRDQAKRTTYAVMYGGSGEQLALELTNEAMRRGGGSVSPQQGCAIREAFFMAFPGVRKWHQAIEDELIQTRSLRSLSGRERHWPGRIMDGDGRVLNEVIKQGWAFKPQEIGATILALGIMDIHETQRHMLTPLIHVHDACLMQAPIAQRDNAVALANKALSRELYGMWFPSEMKCGADWYEAS
jgi:DNA polymerase I - 3''-5'' exonuclease and polymerase domains